MCFDPPHDSYDGKVTMSPPLGARAARVLLSACVSVLLLSATPSRAIAESGSFEDSAGTRGPMDIHRVTVVNEDRLTLRVVVEDLQRRTGRSAAAWIDTRPGRRGPEYLISSGLYDSDWQIFRARNWRVVGDGPLPCAIEQALSYKREVIRWTTGRDCLGRYRGVRVSVETRWRKTIDHSPRRHVLHGRVARH